MRHLAQAKVGSISVGDIVRVLPESIDVPYEWTGAMAEVIGVDGLYEVGDSLTLRAACGVELACETRCVEKLNAIERLAWVHWKSRVDGIREAAAQFKRDRDRENEWITGGEVVIVTDHDTYEKEVRQAFDPKVQTTPFVEEDITQFSLKAWRGRTLHVKARVLKPADDVGGNFEVEVIEDLDYGVVGYGREPGDRMVVGWYQVWRIEPTPEEDE